MTKKYILLFNDDELETKIYTYEEVKEMYDATFMLLRDNQKNSCRNRP